MLRLDSAESTIYNFLSFWTNVLFSIFEKDGEKSRKLTSNLKSNWYKIKHKNSFIKWYYRQFGKENTIENVEYIFPV